MTERGFLLWSTPFLGVVAVAVSLSVGVFNGYGFLGGGLVYGLPALVAGAIVTRSDPSQVVGRLLMWWGFAQTSVDFVDALVLPLAFRPVIVDVAILGVVVGLLALVPWLATVLIPGAAMMRFPDGSWPGRVGQVTGRAWLVCMVIWVALQAERPVGVQEWEAPTPFHLPEDMSQFLAPVFDIPGWLVAVPAGVGAVFGLSTLALNVVRGLRAGPVRRRQLGMVIGFLVVFIPLGALASASPTFGDVAGFATALFPLVVMAAIQRYRLYDIDRLVSRTVTYVVVVAGLVGLYFGLVVLLRGLAPIEGPVPVAISTLGVAFAFRPLARRVQAVVDRRFFRSRYDAADVVSSFAEELRATLDPALAAERTEAVVESTFQVESVSVWLAGIQVGEEPTG